MTASRRDEFLEVSWSVTRGRTGIKPRTSAREGRRWLGEREESGVADQQDPNGGDVGGVAG